MAQSSTEEVVLTTELAREVETIISTTLLDMYTLVIGAFVVLVGVIAVSALRWMYKSTPEWLHTTILNITDKVVTGFYEYAQTTQNKLDDRLAQEVKRIAEDIKKAVLEQNPNTSPHQSNEQ